MSDYVHKKAVRLPLDFEGLGFEEPYDFEQVLKEKVPSLIRIRNKGFEVDVTDEGYYIDWTYYYTYGENSGDFGSARELTKKELKTIKPYFDKLGIDYNTKDLRLVDYCYYNGCEAPDYYDTTSKDESSLFTEFLR